MKRGAAKEESRVRGNSTPPGPPAQRLPRQLWTPLLSTSGSVSSAGRTTSTNREEGYELLLGSAADDERRGQNDLHRDGADEVIVHPALPESTPTAAQTASFRYIPAPLPWTTYIMAIVEFAERASFYGVSGLTTNFIQRPLPPGGPGTGAPPPGSEITPGALGMGLQVTTTVGVLLTLVAYTAPLVGGVFADLRWGKFKTIAIGVGIGAVAHILTVWIAIPSILQGGGGFVPFLLALLLLGTGTGMVKASIAPIMADQYPVENDYVKTGMNGETVIVGREATVQRIMSAYMACTNLGAFVGVASTFAERYVGFWLAFLLPCIIFLLLPPMLFYTQPYLVTEKPPSSSELLNLVQSAKSWLNLQATSVYSKDTAEEPLNAGPTSMIGSAPASDAQKALQACKFFLFFAIYNVADGGLYSLFISLAGSMSTGGIPNDFLNIAHPLFIVTTIPILNHYIYPFLQARHVAFGPVKRVVTGFVVAAAAMTWSAVLQHAVYRTSPCGDHATTCEEGTGVSPLGVWLVLPTPILLGISEAVGVVSALEIGYMLSPLGMRSMVNAFFLFTQALAALLVLFFIPLMADPYLVWPFAITAAATLLSGGVIWHQYAYLDRHS